MGLDMYLDGRKWHRQDWEKPENDPKQDGHRIRETVLELGYWRKHPNLHGYIVQTFADGKDECQDIELTAEQLRQIIAAVKAGKLPVTTGFFFGHSDGTETPEDLRLLEGAIAWLEDKSQEEKEWRSVIYHASW